MVENVDVDWSGCQLVEATPGIHSGDPVLVGTRMPENAIVDNFHCGLGIAEISEQFEIAEELTDEILT